MDWSKQKSLGFAGAVGLVAAIAYSAIGVFPAYEYRTDVFVGEYALTMVFNPSSPSLRPSFLFVIRFL